jgi:acyl-ACP thioesterase
MILQTVWKEETIVRAFDTDIQKRWKPASIFQALTEIAGSHADHLGVGFQEMFSRDMAWILSRIKIQFYEFPLMGEKVVIQTWPKGLQQKLFFMRDFHLTAKDGRRFASASTAWLLVNIKARRLLMPTALYKPVPDNNGQAAINEPLEKITIPDGLPEHLSVKAGYSSVDLMEHANNARYAEWICDCFPIEEWKKRELSSIQVNYINEVRPGEGISLGLCRADNDPTTWLVSGTNQNTGLRAFEAAVSWK